MVDRTHRGTPHTFMRGIGGYTHSETAVYAGGIPLFYRVNPWESGCYNTVKQVAYMPKNGDLDTHTFGCQFFCYKILDTSPILRIVVCIWERGTIYMKELIKKITKKIAR